jgi:hypothetical protein
MSRTTKPVDRPSPVGSRTGGLVFGSFPLPARISSARESASFCSARLATIPSASRRRFSDSTSRSEIASAHSSPIVRGWTSWYDATKRLSVSTSTRLSVCST